MKGAAKRTLQGRSRWVYVLPILHLCACLIVVIAMLIPSVSFLGVIEEFILLGDLPISIVSYALAFHYSWLATAWLFVVGTLWWYLLGRAAEFVIDTRRNLRD
jgi:hypothetical protein